MILGFTYHPGGFFGHSSGFINFKLATLATSRGKTNNTPPRRHARDTPAGFTRATRPWRPNTTAPQVTHTSSDSQLGGQQGRTETCSHVLPRGAPLTTPQDTNAARRVVSRPSQPFSTVVRSSQPFRTTSSSMEAVGKGDNNPEDCPVCLTGFDDLMQRPHTMPCGHTVCTLCIDKLKEQGHVTCPECRVSHAVPKGGHFPVCYTLEAVLRMMRNIKVAAAAASSPPSAEEGKGAAGVAVKKETMDLSKKMRSFLEEQEATVMATITACQKAQSQLDEYQKSLTNWGERQQQLEDRLQGLMDQSKSARELVQQEGSRAAAMGEEVKRGEQGLHNVLETLRTPATYQEAGVAVAEVFRCIGEAEQMVEKCQQCFPDASTITVVRKVREASSAAAQAIQAALETHHIVIKEEVHPQSDPEEPRPQADLDFTILDRVQLIMMLSWKQAEDLRSLTQPNRTLLQDGLVFAVHQVEGQRRHAKISFEDGRLYLHALREHPQPLGMATLQMSEVVPPSPPCTVFLDLSWPGSAPRQVQIHLSQDTPWGRQLVMLCTGQHGPSYINTLSAKVRNKGQTGEWMSFGDGFGASDLLPELDVGKYKTSDKAGAVFWLVDEEHWDACGQFGIFTRDCQCKCESTRVFGEVVDGLHVVAEAAQHSNIKEVTVVDCGIVLRE